MFVREMKVLLWEVRSVCVCRVGGLCSDYTLMSQVDNSIHAYGYPLEWNSKVTIGGLRYDFDVSSGLRRYLKIIPCWVGRGVSTLQQECK